VQLQSTAAEGVLRHFLRFCRLIRRIHDVSHDMSTYQGSMRPQGLTIAPAPWPGHHAATQAVLKAILARGATGSHRRLTRAEFNLVAACGFWAAAMNHGLFRHLAGAAFIRLRAAEESFAAVRASEARGAVRLARLRLKIAGTPAPLREIAEQLEAELAATKEPVDDFIADFAREHVRPGSIAGSDIGPR